MTSGIQYVLLLTDQQWGYRYRVLNLVAVQIDHMVSETTQSRTAKNVTHAFPFWVRPICVKMEIFFCTNSPTGIQRIQTFHISKNTTLNYSVCCGRRTVYAAGG